MLDGNDHKQRLEALVTAQSRTMDGRFRGKSAVYSAPLPMPEFLSLDEAKDRINRLIDTFAEQVEFYSGQGPAPFFAIAASPGAGKSLLTRRAIARGLFSELSGNGTYYVPTLALAEEAHLDFTMLGFPSFVWRGRSAPDPDAIQPPDEPRPRMCKRFTLAEQAAAKGFAVYQTLCKKQLPSGRFEKCPHFDTCRYLRQLEGLPAAGAVVIKTHAMIARDTASIDDKPALRVIDESPVSTLTEHLEVPFEEFERELAYTSDAVARAAVDFLLGNVAGQPASILPADFRQAAETLLNLAVPGGTPAMREEQLTRAKGAIEQARAAEQKAREELASLNATITALAEEGIEERLSTLTDQRAEAEARAARYETEVRALTRLRRALDEARTTARDAYFGPVLRELQPLLAILHPGAELTIDDQSLLPATLTRNGQAEALEILSGGTREQVAILTRLAFARLFAASGRSVPVILDDALVHSDDDRIEAMFDALHRTARDQQILVLTCRQRAFAALGGERAEVQVEAV